MDEKQLIEDAISLLEDQMLDVHPLLKQELRYEADGTPYIVLIQDQGIGGVKKFRFSPEEIETRLAAAKVAVKASALAEAKAGEAEKPKGKAGDKSKPK